MPLHGLVIVDTAHVTAAKALGAQVRSPSHLIKTREQSLEGVATANGAYRFPLQPAGGEGPYLAATQELAHPSLSYGGKRLRLAGDEHRGRDEIDSSGFFVEWQLMQEAEDSQ